MATRVTLFLLWLIFAITVAESCRRHKNKSAGTASLLLFNGTGVSPNDVDAIEKILDSLHINYMTANSAELNAMNLSELKSYRLLVLPGGNFIEMGNSIEKNTAYRIKQAVVQGLNYFGICAGGFLAGGSSYYNSLNLTSGLSFGFFAAEKQGIRKAALPITGPNGKTLTQYWEDGPQFSGWGQTVARYPDGSPAVAEGRFGKGFVLLSGIHAEAPASWRKDMVFNTPVSTDNAYACTLIRAALQGIPLPRY
ncbi:hypothetical protein BEL04_20140 [Mucilaginibacter sp. PPCGB 2223]|uniref:BPL-N domain-containing protein n=1 Tax=Mucilaginibacter sp. PPCGB 2223 TaxID=1886027 RepID=UPI000825B9B6|nr:BPL-N domain-containing protein [Mucilaginibacter sp. PPCGB 2223]OCX51029.1 hypothetical protein BEL04_20140 [Mucilaginibacter sp. PPCGB 2223]